MGTLYLVRHGQASFGAADYDQLSALGHRQCVRLGEYFQRHGRRFDAVLSGSLKRHAQSLAGIAEGMGQALVPQVRPGLDEYDGAALIAAVHPEPLAVPDSPELYRRYFGLLRQGLLAWMAGRAAPAGMPSHADFVAGVVAALDHARTQHGDGDVLVVSSGGPISTAVSHVLGVANEVAIDLNLRMRNSALTEFDMTPARHRLVSFNALPHIDHLEVGALLTYS